jgi:hypothetical protein
MTAPTYKIAMAAGRDAGNRNAAAHGRTVWAAEDFDVAADVVAKIMGEVL